MKIESRQGKTKNRNKKDYKFIMNPELTRLLYWNHNGVYIGIYVCVWAQRNSGGGGGG